MSFRSQHLEILTSIPIPNITATRDAILIIPLEALKASCAIGICIAVSLTSIAATIIATFLTDILEAGIRGNGG